MQHVETTFRHRTGRAADRPAHLHNGIANGGHPLQQLFDHSEGGRSRSLVNERDLSEGKATKVAVANRSDGSRVRIGHRLAALWIRGRMSGAFRQCLREHERSRPILWVDFSPHGKKEQHDHDRHSFCPLPRSSLVVGRCVTPGRRGIGRRSAGKSSWAS